MGDEEFDLFVRRWSLRLFIAGITLPVLLYPLSFYFWGSEAQKFSISFAVACFVASGLTFVWRPRK